MVAWCTQNLRRDGSSFMWHQPCQRCKYTTSVDIQKARYKKLVTHVESHASAVSLLESGEQRYIKAIDNNNNNMVIVQELWESRGGRPNELSGFRGRKDLLNHASALVSVCP